ncbi:regulator of G-protein signaling 9-binding protein-like [Rhinatrema bivittatum]|uniref:regulator of G-protein signaling 9-binding protein-like n=1 Tax=Rhinatrema bivittatum TaxID=194408 RepID=UPI00112D8BC6|nr:regulator of G-protein signaling 9-binding protein-like [Rhinatrema bivittatum]XP_029468242.1 regulator of G-protein signaling 9-binding protein-like [Rhinatrema bivittatum]XP_029468243.1 regulator of G-protein signaling 9-binding protein-like [Rhinatrema bivittatum]XP_029468244.1 regulator of G-protein signaling 9-binding protein-like [Rhinatrema bivittatum]
MLGSHSHSVEEPSNKDIIEECKKIHAALNKITACYRQLVLCVGGTSDSIRLRGELEDSRKKSYDLSTGLRNKLMMLLTDCEVSPEERVELERIWVLFMSTLELYQQDLYKAYHLSQVFPLHTSHKCLINTGMVGKSAEVSYRARPVKAGSSKHHENVEHMDQQCTADLIVQIQQVESMLHEMEMKISIPVWTVEAREEAWAEVTSSFEVEEGSAHEILAVEETHGRGCCAQGQPWHRFLCLFS